MMFSGQRNFLHRFYGASSKPTTNYLSSKVNSSFKKYAAISSSLIDHLVSILKGFQAARDVPESDSKRLHPNVPESDSTRSISYSLVKTKDLPHLDLPITDSLSSNVSKNYEDATEKDLKAREFTRKAKISKASLQQRSRFLVQSLNEAISSGSQLSRLEEICKHLLLYPHQKSEMCKAGLLRTSLRLRNYSRDEAVQSQALVALTLIGYVQPPRGQGIRILSIDGGGTRGIIAIEVLRQLEARTKKKVHELFDFMCGVSSGAILCLLLGSLHFSLDECEALYRQMSKDIFQPSTFWGTGRLMWNHAYYDTTAWVAALKNTFGERLMIESSKSTESPKIAVFSAIMNLPQLQPFAFRSYGLAPRSQSQYLGSCQYRIWEAIRASGAAPGYFEEYSLDGFLHQDGGLMVNNPTALGIHEARLLWPTEPIQCVLSLGNGRSIPASQSEITSTSLKTKIFKVIDSATDTEGIHVVLNDLLSPYTYFRINPYLTEFFPLDENRAEKLDQMKRDTEMYLRRNEYKFNTCAMTLSIPRSYFKKAKYWLNVQKDLIFS